jgi:hypothetical protein
MVVSLLESFAASRFLRALDADVRDGVPVDHEVDREVRLPLEAAKEL